MRARRCAAVATVVLTVALSGFGAPPAGAVTPPVVEPGPPPSGPVAPAQPTEQKSICGVPTDVLPGTDFTKQTSAEAMLEYRKAWRFSRGAGQKVAVIDTGVNRHPRLRSLEPGGDYVSNSDGLVDCDAHGTLVAGIIGAVPADGDSFAGVAPEAAILSIRQNSGAYSVAGTSSTQNDDPNATSVGYGNTHTLALAIVRAVDLGATVINLSEVACAPVAAGMDDRELGRAVRYAYERNVVVVAAAGNFNSQSMCNAQNNMDDPNQPLDTGWNSVSTIASPAWFSDYVLSVGAVTTSATPADFSLHGPWLAVAAPGERVTSLDADGPGLSNAQLGQQGLAPLNGTSFAAPFVSGVVALIRSRYPGLTAGEVMDLVERTARTPGNGPNQATGYGVVDPVAALTYQLPPKAAERDVTAASPISGPPQPDAGNVRARRIVFTVTAACLAAMVAAVAVSAARRRTR
ncbi:type VII secretion-associated serine protease mycosin [Mycolicibacterium conceptionense]|uniref:Type VII secretion-associated serine protease mycosin n=1 Tax=Mycolicibacterium conceptionense TaxID=451644 RepID=A0A1A0PTV0_9MYCO|nr:MULTISPECIES: type VII secretion-associated serine protease mycosin [Mycolicibacterium]MCW1821243.1 type VII secretion-associated serine protease mycosin [Mycolicibacterium senegalense]OBB13192.1 type VII secretion-associated serine protease mycosin [Mycolicibacterium conceptionense]OBE98443.1 type VII secretion-associated serine protease mycosin [Mycolicibacterium conceptionense]OBF14972.1 type VII secretion-associated serine protease mycosin [Mycolicibacterium conceptionense]OBF30696.1 ty